MELKYAQGGVISVHHWFTLE